MGNTEIAYKISGYMDLYTSLWAFSGSIAVMKDGQTIFKKGYEYANREHNISNTPETKHRIWSITKQFTAAAILLLEERGLLKTEDSFKKYFPELEELNPDITIHHLLTHTSGIFNYSTMLDSHNTFQRMNHKREELLKLFASKPLDFEPGTQWNYCNTGYYLLGVLIEKLSGKTYSEFLTENIFNPLGMLNTGLDDGKKIISNMAQGYYLNERELIHCNYINMELIFSSGSMYSTVEDLLIWNEALNSHKLLSKASVDKINTPYKNEYGYGVGIHINGSRRVIHHSGSCEGFLTEMHRYVDDDFAVVILSNYGFTAVNKLCKEIAALAFEEKDELPVKPEVYPMSNSTLESYLGIYEEGDLKLELKKEHERISLVINDETVLSAYPVSENTFHHTWIDEEYTINKDENGQLSLWGVRKK